MFLHVETLKLKADPNDAGNNLSYYISSLLSGDIIAPAPGNQNISPALRYLGKLQTLPLRLLTLALLHIEQDTDMHHVMCKTPDCQMFNKQTISFPSHSYCARRNIRVKYWIQKIFFVWFIDPTQLDQSHRNICKLRCHLLNLFSGCFDEAQPSTQKDPRAQNKDDFTSSSSYYWF